MNVYEEKTIRNRLCNAFPKGFVNRQFEFIAHPQRNSYFSLEGVETERQLDAKIIDWLSREAIKGGTKATMKYHFDGINRFLGTNFTPKQMETIYTHLGNACNHQRTLDFIDSGYDMRILRGEMQNEG